VSESTSRGGIRGHMRLVCAPDARGISCLREQSFRAPIHLSKPFWEENTLVLNVVNPTAGLLEGDRIVQEATVRTGARLLLTMPGASRAHRTRGGWAAMQQSFRVEAGAFLEVFPEVFIPQAGAHYRQTTRLEVDEAGELLFFESVAPGRTASGESFKYNRLEWHTDLIAGTRLVIRERFHMEPRMREIRALREHFPNAYYASVLAFSPKFATHPDGNWELENLQREGILAGWSRLTHRAGICVKILSQDAQLMRLTIDSVRQILYRVLKCSPPGLRRVAGR